MPSTPYARIRIKVNGGAPQTGRVVVEPGDTIQLEAESYDGWSAPVARWEWYSFPDDWTGPGGDWTTESVPQSDGTTATVYYWLGNSAPPSFTAPAIEFWGKYLPRLIVNDGYKGGAPSADVVDTSTLMEMISETAELHDLAWLEGNQAGQEKKWSRDHQENLRLIDAKFAFILANLSAPSEASFVAGRQATDLTTDVSIAFRPFNPSIFNESGRTITFRAWLRVTSGATAELELYNVSDGATVHTFTSTSSVGEPKSQVLTVPGNLPNSSKNYELRLRRSGGIAGDIAECFFAALEIAYL